MDGNKRKKQNHISFQLREWPNGLCYDEQERIVVDVFGIISNELEKEYNRRGRR